MDKCGQIEKLSPCISPSIENFTIFNLHSINFHWPSEHQIDGIQYDMEIQFIHYNNQTSMDDALTFTEPELADSSNSLWGDIAIISVLVTEGRFNNLAYEKLLSSLKFLKSVNSSREITKTVPLEMLLPNDTLKFYSYLGSFTSLVHVFDFSARGYSVGCFPNVEWFVFEVRSYFVTG